MHSLTYILYFGEIVCYPSCDKPFPLQREPWALLASCPSCLRHLARRNHYDCIFYCCVEYKNSSYTRNKVNFSSHRVSFLSVMLK